MNLIHLATAAIIDLGLNRPCYSGLPAIGVLVDMNQHIHGRSVNQGLQSSDERRAVLGVFYFTGKLSSCFRRIDPMRWSQHLDDACQALKNAAEYPTDIYAVYLVQLHRITERYFHYPGLQSPANVPVRTYVTCFEEDIQRFRQNLPPGLGKQFDRLPEHGCSEN